MRYMAVVPLTLGLVTLFGCAGGSRYSITRTLPTGESFQANANVVEQSASVNFTLTLDPKTGAVSAALAKTQVVPLNFTADSLSALLRGLQPFAPLSASAVQAAPK